MVSRLIQVTAILVLYGLPRLLTGSVLAHELMHAWLRVTNTPRLSLDVEEGLCQLMALLWLENHPPFPEVRSTALCLIHFADYKYDGGLFRVPTSCCSRYPACMMGIVLSCTAPSGVRALGASTPCLQG